MGDRLGAVVEADSVQNKKSIKQYCENAFIFSAVSHLPFNDVVLLNTA